MYIYLPVGKRAYFEIYSERFVFNGNTCLLLFIGAFQITVSIQKSCMYTVKFSGWLRVNSKQQHQHFLPCPALPDPGDCARPREAAVFQAANDAFETIITCATDSSFATLRKRKRDEYYNQEVRYCDMWIKWLCQIWTRLKRDFRQIALIKRPLLF